MIIPFSVTGWDRFEVECKAGEDSWIVEYPLLSDPEAGWTAFLCDEEYSVLVALGAVEGLDYGIVYRWLESIRLRAS